MGCCFSKKKGSKYEPFLDYINPSPLPTYYDEIDDDPFVPFQEDKKWGELEIPDLDNNYDSDK